jgi:hypothetical protein
VPPFNGIGRDEAVMVTYPEVDTEIGDGTCPNPNDGDENQDEVGTTRPILDGCLRTSGCLFQPRFLAEIVVVHDTPICKSSMAKAKLGELMLRQSMLQKKHLSLCHHATTARNPRPSWSPNSMSITVALEMRTSSSKSLCIGDNSGEVETEPIVKSGLLKE